MRPLSLLAVSMVLLDACRNSPSPAVSRPLGSPHSSQVAVELVQRIRRADYEGDRVALRNLFQQLAPIPEEPGPASRLLYWRGFALWRRAFNGFNDQAPPAELEQDLQEAIGQFEQALSRDPRFVDAKTGIISCMGALMFLHPKEPDRIQAALPRLRQLLKDSETLAPDNPRYLWVRGPTEWWTPPGTPPEKVDQRQSRALATYARGLELAGRARADPPDPLEPSWGEPEILMSLAWSNLNRRVPDVGAAESYNREALALVPHWHYVRDILMVQIQSAKKAG